MFVERKYYPIIYADFEKDAINFGPRFEMWHLQAFTRSVDGTHIRRLILEHNHSLVHLSTLQMDHILLNILEICHLFPKLKTLTFIPHARTALAETRLDRLIQMDNVGSPITRSNVT